MKGETVLLAARRCVFMCRASVLVKITAGQHCNCLSYDMQGSRVSYAAGVSGTWTQSHQSCTSLALVPCQKIAG